MADGVVRLWKRPAEELLNGDLGVAPLAMLGRLPEQLSLEDGLAAIAQRVVESRAFMASTRPRDTGRRKREPLRHL